MNIGLAPKLVPLGIAIDEMCQKRADMNYLHTKVTLAAINIVEYEIVWVDTWPAFRKNEGIFTGICFKVTSQAKEKIQECYTELLS